VSVQAAVDDDAHDTQQDRQQHGEQDQDLGRATGAPPRDEDRSRNSLRQLIAVR